MEDAARNERDKLIVRLLADAGLREGELVGLRLADLRDVKQADRRVLFSLKVTGKGSRDRMVPIQPAMYRRIQAYVSQYRPKDSGSTRLFLASRKRPHGDYAPLTGSGVRQMIGSLGEQARIGKRVYPHLLRHSFATYFLQKGGSALDLAKILGHSSLTMITTVYAHLSDSDSDRAMMRVLSAAD
jgi:site-specific recombinase XerD